MVGVHARGVKPSPGISAIPGWNGSSAGHRWLESGMAPVSDLGTCIDAGIPWREIFGS